MGDWERFRSKFKIDATTLCWEWAASVRVKGLAYGQFWDSKRKKMVLSHRWSFERHCGKEAALDVLHLCHNQACVNPNHLAEGTHQENMNQMKRARRSKTRHGTTPITLTDRQKEKIRGLYATGKYSHQQLANNFGVSKPWITRILNR